jgi:hypothetical protein
MLDSKESAKIVPTLITGSIKASLSFGSIEEAFMENISPKPAKIKPLKISHDSVKTE